MDDYDQRERQKLNVVFCREHVDQPGVRMINNPTWAGIREAYANSFATLKSLPCDVFLGPHAPFFDMEAKGTEDVVR